VDLIFAGLIGIIDPPWPQAREAVARAKDAGIRPIMITGDHPRTAAVIARELGITADDRTITGADLERLSPDAGPRTVAEVSVYARVNPEHKLRIVDALRKTGAVVAMTGDGVNDAPALRRADIGVAMGVVGTDVAKQAADMVLADDNFASIVAAVEEGRAIFDNIHRQVRTAGAVIEVGPARRPISGARPIANARDQRDERVRRELDPDGRRVHAKVVLGGVAPVSVSQAPVERGAFAVRVVNERERGCRFYAGRLDDPLHAEGLGCVNERGDHATVVPQEVRGAPADDDDVFFRGERLDDPGLRVEERGTGHQRRTRDGWAGELDPEERCESFPEAFHALLERFDVGVDHAKRLGRSLEHVAIRVPQVEPPRHLTADRGSAAAKLS
jgi:soluble P-type ATPase